jgi:hypothetical protein
MIQISSLINQVTKKEVEVLTIETTEDQTMKVEVAEVVDMEVMTTTTEEKRKETM